MLGDVDAYDVIAVGLTMNFDNVALMPCNRGPAKGQFGRSMPWAGRWGATSTRPSPDAKHKQRAGGTGPRAQLYGLAMKHTLERQDNLYVKQTLID